MSAHAGASHVADSWLVAWLCAPFAACAPCVLRVLAPWPGGPPGRGGGGGQQPPGLAGGGNSRGTKKKEKGGVSWYGGAEVRGQPARGAMVLPVRKKKRRGGCHGVPCCCGGQWQRPSPGCPRHTQGGRASCLLGTWRALRCAVCAKAPVPGYQGWSHGSACRGEGHRCRRSPPLPLVVGGHGLGRWVLVKRAAGHD